MSDTIAIYRQALKDSTHTLSSIAWELFRQQFDVKRVAKKYTERQAELIPFLYVLVDDKKLYEEGALGSGYAPINAVRLLGEWGIVDAVPRLLTIIEEEDRDIIIADQAAVALEKMPAEAIDAILEYGQKENQDISAAFILTRVGRGDDRCFAFITQVFERVTDELDIISIAECLVSNDVDKAEVYFEEQTKSRKYRRYRQDFQAMLEEKRSGLWD